MVIDHHSMTLEKLLIGLVPRNPFFKVEPGERYFNMYHYCYCHCLYIFIFLKM